MNSSNTPQLQIVKANEEARAFGFHHMLLVTNAQLLNIIDPTDINKRLSGKDRVIGNFDYYGFLTEGIIISGGGFNAKEALGGAALSNAKDFLYRKYDRLRGDIDSMVENDFGKCSMLDYFIREFRLQFPYNKFTLDSEFSGDVKYPREHIIRFRDNFLTSAVPVCIEYILDNDKQIKFTQLYIQAINRIIRLKRDYRDDQLIYGVEYTEPRESSFGLTYIGSRELLFQAYRKAYGKNYPIEKKYVPIQFSWKE